MFSLFRSTLTVGGLTFLSRITGFLRDVITANLLGAGPMADAWVVALRLPNFFRRLLAEGAFSVSFVPMYARKLEEETSAQAKEFANNVLGFMLIVLLAITAIFVLFMPWVIALIAPGFADNPQQADLATHLSRLTFPYLIFICLAALYGGVLNALGRFGPFAFIPVLFNLITASALYLLSPLLHSPAHAAAWGLALVGPVQLAYMIWQAKRAGITLRLTLPKLDGDVKKLLKIMGPGAMGAGVMQINLLFDTIFASKLGEGAISYLYYADRLYQFPLSMIGIAFSTVLLPMLTRNLVAEGEERARQSLVTGVLVSLFLGVPAAAALIVASFPIIATLFQHGAFTLEDSHHTANALAAYSIGIPAFILVKVLSTAYFARENTKSPVKIAIFTTALHIAMALVMMQFWSYVGIALSTSITAYINALFLALGLYRKKQLSFSAVEKRRLMGMLASTALMMGILLLVIPRLEPYFAHNIKYLLMPIIVGSGIALYLVGLVLFKAITLQEVNSGWQMVQAKINRSRS
ncbi:MAG: murein biosynthesis integral membrane protein MurJ [Alphaproteobacteria bacterium]